ncbi:hypothetical protein EV426DRAFT_670262 [Tirmania nivea]|nr:hypothetical protein EV426DRAFT_670262 [Tirmania nivea]
MADQRLSALAGPILYELDNQVQRPPIPPKQPETAQAVPKNGTAYGYDGQLQQYQQAGSFPIRSPSGYAPQAIDQQQQVSPSEIAAIPESPVGTSHSRQPPQETLPEGRHQSLAAPSTISPTDSNRGSYLTQPDTSFTQPKYAGSDADYGNSPSVPAAPHYNAPVTGYYAPGAPYNPVPYPQAQSPPPIKLENSYYAGAPPTPAPPTEPLAGAAADGGKKKRICGMTITNFLVMCVILFLIIAGAVLGGVFGSDLLEPDPPVPTSTSGATKTDTDTAASDTGIITTFPTDNPPPDLTSSPTSSSTSHAYRIPSGTWTVPGELSVTSGTCIDNPTRLNYKEVWYCPENLTVTFDIKDYSTDTELSYFLDMDTPTRVRGIVGIPPTSNKTESGKSQFWEFIVNYKQQASFTTGDNCEVEVSLTFFLGKIKAVVGIHQ